MKYILISVLCVLGMSAAYADDGGIVGIQVNDISVNQKVVVKKLVIDPVFPTAGENSLKLWNALISAGVYSSTAAGRIEIHLDSGMYCESNSLSGSTLKQYSCRYFDEEDSKDKNISGIDAQIIFQVLSEKVPPSPGEGLGFVFVSPNSVFCKQYNDPTVPLEGRTSCSIETLINLN